MKYKFLFLLILLSSLFTVNYSQEHAPDHLGISEDSLEMHQPMVSRFSFDLPMNSNGSGTGWLPGNSPMYGYMLHRKDWMFMFHGNLFLRYNKQDIFKAGTRGDSQFDAPNWLMAMGQRKIGERHLFSFSSMFSLDPLTVGGNGYPLLFQTGETWQGQPLIDRQHPHNLFTELSLGYSYMLSKQVDLFLYLAYPGEPALGPVAFMHRVAAFNNPDSPLGHHWQDATHITFGVATLGLRYKIFKLEASRFTGKEPSENRYGFDPPLMDSWSGRVSANPHKSLVIQLSHAYLVSPETTRPGVNMRRTTASVLHQIRTDDPEKYFSSSLFWGLNQSDHNEHSFGYEFTWRLSNYYLYGRYEWIQKDVDELLIPTNGNHPHNGTEHHILTNINAVTIGLNRIVFKALSTNASVGMQGTLFVADDFAAPVYGKTPVAFQIYTRIYPSLIN